MKKLICALIGVAALVASATTYIQTSSTGVAPWKPVKDSVSQAHFADSARKADSSHAATYADSARVSGLADSAKKSGTASNSLALGGIAASQYGTLAQDTLIAKKVASDTATVLRAGIASAITTSESYATARISDSLSANTRAWTTLGAAKSSIHDSLAVERTFDTLVARNVARDTATSLRAYVGSYINQPLLTTSSPTFATVTGDLTGTASNASALGGVDADYFVQGSNSSRTTLLTGAVTSQSQLLKSGFYCSQTWTDAPVKSTWTHLIHSQYANDGGAANNWSFDIAANFGSAADPGSPENYYVRAIANGTSTGWRTLIHSANYPSFNNFTSGLSTTTLTASGLITANGGITGQGNLGSASQAWNKGYFSVAGIDIGGGLLTFNSPSTSAALLGVTAHPMVIGTATGSVAFPAGIGLNGPLGLSVVSVGGTTYSASAHKGRILTIAPSTIFTLPLGSAGDWFVIQSSAAQGPGQTAGVITPSGTTIYIRGTAYSGQTSVIGTLVAYCNGVYWYIG